MFNPNSYSTGVDFRLPKKPPTLSDWSGLNILLAQLYNSLQQIIYALNYLCGIGSPPQPSWTSYAQTPAKLLNSSNLNKLYILAETAISAGDQISITEIEGNLTIIKAVASGTIARSDGFAPIAISSGSVGLVILSNGINPGLVGLTPGQRYWLSATMPGSIQTTPPNSAGQIEQYLGIAVDTENLYQDIAYPIQH